MQLNHLVPLATLFLAVSTTFGQANRPARPETPPPPYPQVTPETRTAFHNVLSWPDTDGVHINAHGGGVIYHEGTYYWYGEHRASRLPDNTWIDSPGVNCYSSKDLYNWKNEGVVFKTITNDDSSPVALGCNIERPKVIYNAKTKKFVMWMHLELKGKGYSAALTALATADSPTGPFTFVKALRPNAGQWPINHPEELRKPYTKADLDALPKDKWRENMVSGMYLQRDFAGGQMARDMTLFVDDDGKAYHIASAEENYTLNIHELNDDYTDFTGKYLRVAPGGHNEAPALIKHNGKYHMLASGCTGWDPNEARVLTATSIWGPWTREGNPCEGNNPLMGNVGGANKTFGGQSTYILPIHGKPGAYIAMFDIWRPKNLITSGYIWLPVEFEGDKMKIRFREKWDLSVFNK